MLQRIVDGRTDLVFELRAGEPREVDGVPLLRWCAYYGDVSAIRFLLNRGHQLSDLGENLGLNEAAFHGYWRLCEFLLEQGADVNHPLAATAETSLHAALCKANRPAYDLVVRVLLQAGANPNARTIPGAESGAFMRDCRTRGETPLHRAAAFASEETIRRLLEAGGDRALRDANGDSPLSWASWHLRPDAILRMLTYGEFRIHPARNSTFDHGSGWGEMERAQMGAPRESLPNS
jgi:ankyrin repeat protein